MFYITLINQNLLSQGQCNIWYFGNNAGLNFNTPTPTPLLNGKINQPEGAATISDSDGNLLFYTDGQNVYNKSHLLMPNGTGLFGHPSTSQTAIIVPKPGTFNATIGRYNNYYIITVDFNRSFLWGIPAEGTRGVCFSEVDMTLSSGFGDVISSTKNTYLFGTYTTEKITVAKHSNGCDYWAIAKPVGSPEFYSYHISSTGFNITPVVSTITASAYSPTLSAGVGYMKISPNNKLLAVINGYSPSGAAFYQNGLFIHNFDNSTGIISPKFYHASSGSPLFPYAFGNFRLGYGVEFSPNSKLVYTTGLYSSSIQQYDLTSLTNAAFQSSRRNIGLTTSPAPDGNNYTACALQTGPNGKIYVALDGNDSIGVINNPNVYDVGCNYVDRAQQVGSGLKICKYSLPNFVPSLVKPVNKIIKLNDCVLNDVGFVITDTSEVLAYNWIFTPLSSTLTTIATSTTFSTSVTFPTYGQYIATVNLSFPCYTLSLKDTFNIGSPIVAVNITNPIKCNGGTATVTANPSISPDLYIYNWQSNSSTTNTAVYSVGTYSLQINDIFGCLSNTTFTITEPPIFTTSLSAGSINCYGNTTTLSITGSGGTLPYTGTGTYTLLSGIYSYTVTDNNSCSIINTFTITQPPILNAIVTNTSTSNCGVANGSATVSVTGGTSSYTYSWSPPSPFPSYTSTTAVTNSLAAGNNNLTVIDANGCTYTLAASISNPAAPSLTVSSNNVLCNGEASGSASVIASGGTPAYSYTWSNSSNSTSVSSLTAGNYSIVVMDASLCQSTQTFVITEPTVLATAISNIINVNCFGGNNGSASVTTTGGTPIYSYNWLPSGGSTSTGTNLAQGIYTVTITDNNNCTKTNTVEILGISQDMNISITDTVKPDCGNYTNGSLTVGVTGGTPTYTYLWNNGSTTPSNTNITNSTYTVTVTDANNCSKQLEITLDCFTSFFIPEIFSPNNDGKNDVFEIKGIYQFPNNKLTIFNRWGNVVYQKEKYNNEWDGKPNVNTGTGSDLLPQGTYYVLFDFGDDGKNETYKGYVQLEY